MLRCQWPLPLRIADALRSSEADKPSSRALRSRTKRSRKAASPCTGRIPSTRPTRSSPCIMSGSTFAGFVAYGRKANCHVPYRGRAEDNASRRVDGHESRVSLEAVSRKFASTKRIPARPRLLSARHSTAKALIRKQFLRLAAGAEAFSQRCGRWRRSPARPMRLTVGFFRRPEDFAKYADALRKAGLPE